MNQGVSVKGMKELNQQLEALGKDAKQALSMAMMQSAQDVANEADELVPVDEGILRATQSVTPKGMFTNRPQVTIAYGGPSAPYALVQHERTDYEHPGGGQAKYLEEPFLKETARWPYPLIERIKNASRFF